MGDEVKSMRNLLMATCAAVLVAACGQTPGVPLTRGDYRLYEATTDHSQIAVIDSGSHVAQRSLPLGTPSSDWQHLYSVSSNTLLDTDPQTGSTLNKLTLPGTYHLPPATLSGVPGGLSQDGKWLVAQAFDPTAKALPSATHFIVMSTSFGSRGTRIDMRGYYQFDAISNDGRRLYLIEYLTYSDYRVRVYNVAEQRLEPYIVVDKSQPNERMTGLRLSGVASPDGQWLYSIYVREKEGAFIHALNLGQPFAFCIDLPGNGSSAGTGDVEFHWSLALTRDGSRLYAANALMGVVSEINTGSNGPALVRTVHIGSPGSTGSLFIQDVQAKEFGTNATVLSLDEKTLVTASGSGIVWIDTKTLHARMRALNEWRVGSLALTPDGKVLYALSSSGKIAEVSMESGKVGATFDPGAGYPMALMRVAAS